MIGRVLRTLRVGKCDCIRLLPTRGLLAVVEVVDRYEAAPSLECLAEGRLALDPLGLGVDVRESDFDVLRTERHEAPTHYVQAAFAGLGIVVDDRERVGWRHVPAGRDVRGGPLRCDREDELDFADIGGETDAATHSSSITSPWQRPKRSLLGVTNERRMALARFEHT